MEAKFKSGDAITFTDSKEGQYTIADNGRIVSSSDEDGKWIYTVNSSGLNFESVPEESIEFALGSTERDVDNILREAEKNKETPLRELAKDSILHELRFYDKNVQIEFENDNRIKALVSNEVVPRLIGKKGANIDLIQKKLGLHITVEPRENTLKKQLSWTHREHGAGIDLIVDRHFTGQQVDINDGNSYLFSAAVGKKGSIHIRKKSEVGKRTLSAIAKGSLKVFA